MSLTPDPDIAGAQTWHATEYHDFEAEWRGRWDALSEDLPPCVFHYTHADGLKGILTNRVIWATDARYLNDTTELSYINTVILETADKLKSDFKSDAALAFLAAASDGLLNGSTGTQDIYVSCFCADGDQLSQWRGYGGYALGFDPGRLGATPRLALRRVVYDRAVQEDFVREVLEFCARWLEGTTGRPPFDHACVVALQATKHTLSEPAFCFKHSGFAEEKEWRLVHRVMGGEHLAHAPLLFRPETNGVVPYVELRPNGQQLEIDALLPISDLVVGPNPHPQLALTATQQMLDSTGLPGVIARSSGIPLRV